MNIASMDSGFILTPAFCGFAPNVATLQQEINIKTLRQASLRKAGRILTDLDKLVIGVFIPL
jgi:hypothetical protein